MEVDSIDGVSFEKLYKANVSKIYNVALLHSGNKDTAEEITQEAFYKLYVHRKNVNAKAAVSWLYTTVRRMALNYKRDSWYEMPGEDIGEEPVEELASDGFEEELIQLLQNKEYQKLINEILDDLYRKNKRWYEAITCTYLLEKPQKDVAEEMGVSLEVLHSMLYRAKKWIQKKYRDKYDCIKNP